MSEIVIRWGADALPTGTGAVPALDQQQWEGLYTRLENGAGALRRGAPAGRGARRHRAAAPRRHAADRHRALRVRRARRSHHARDVLRQRAPARPVGARAGHLSRADGPVPRIRGVPRRRAAARQGRARPGRRRRVPNGRARHAGHRHICRVRAGPGDAALHVRRRNAQRLVHGHAERHAGGPGSRQDDAAARRLWQHRDRMGLPRPRRLGARPPADHGRGLPRRPSARLPLRHRSTSRARRARCAPPATTS